MPKYFVHSSFFFLVITALTGIWMRLFTLSTDAQTLPYDHILHAHSHVAVLGWTFLAALIIYFHITWDQIAKKRQAIAIVITTFLITLAMFLAFLWQGYALFSIIFSSLHIIIEYWAILFVFRSLKTTSNMPILSRWYIKGALISLLISSIGPWSLGAIASQGLKESPIFDMAIYFYLHFQYNGWLYFMLIGLFIFVLTKRGIKIRSKLVSFSFWISIVALFPGYLLSILWANVGMIGILFAWIGAIGQMIGVILISIVFFSARRAIISTFGSKINKFLILVFLLLLTKGAMELGLLHIPFAELIYETRSVVIGYLHLTFLGFISFLLISLFLMTNILERTSNNVWNGLLVFLLGFFLNEFILFISGLLSWVSDRSFYLQNELLLVASILLTIGTLLLWTSFQRRKNLSRGPFPVERS